MKNIYIILEGYYFYMDINFEYYKIFYYVAKYENITKAAAALKSSQPNVTRVIKLLEGQLGCRLFIRGARGVCLTEQGERLYVHVEAAYRHLSNAGKEIGSQALSNGGTVEIGATETALHLFLLNALYRFRLQYPDIKIKIHNYATPQILKYLASGKLDFAVVTTPFDLSERFSCFKAFEFEEILVGGIQYAKLSESIFGLEDLKEYPWIGLGKDSVTHRMYKDFFIGHGVDYEPDMEVASSDLMIPLIENNFGIGFVPKKLAQPFLKEGKLVRIQILYSVPMRSIQIVSDTGRGKSMAADTLYGYLRKG